LKSLYLDGMYRILIILILAACMSPQPELTYADGSANRYVITPTQLNYIPVKPEESSTGIYSGGEPAQVALSSEQFNHVKELFESALAQTDQQITDRIKTSGLVVIQNGTVRREAILKPGSPILIQLEAELKKIAERK
jgi:hypothetical protein